MNLDLRDGNLSAVLAEGRRLADAATRAFGHLSPQQVNWKPREEAWSIGQCFDHLILSNEGFFPIIAAIREGRRRQSIWGRMPLLPRVFGRLLIRKAPPRLRANGQGAAGLLPLTQPDRPGHCRALPRSAGSPANPDGSDPRPSRR